MTTRSEETLTASPVTTLGTESAELEASDRVGAMIAVGVGAATIVGLMLATSDHWLLWCFGQIVLACAFLQWFVLLHEAGHLTLFRSRGANLCFGHLAGFIALIPFESWRRVHGMHHLWTGWQDLDPTTAALVPRARSRLALAAVDGAWRFWLPLFSILYRVGNYWNVARLWRMFPAPAQRRAIVFNAVALVFVYGVMLWVFGPWSVLGTIGFALFLSLALQDPLILSQHTHIPQRVSGGAKVAPLSAAEQETYTRSLAFPRMVARWLLFNFNAHELHHRHVAVPGYRLHRIARTPPNEVHWWHWLMAAKRLRGSTFLFQNRDATGFQL